MVNILSFPAPVFAKKIVHLEMGMRRHGERIGKFAQQFEQPVAVFVPELVSTLVFGDRNMKADHNEVIPGNQFEVVLQKIELIFAKATPVSPSVAWIWIVDIIEDDVVNLPIVERIISRTEDRL